MSFGNFLRRLSFDTERSQQEASESSEGMSGISSIFTAPSKLIESVNVKTGHLVSDLNQKLDLGTKFDSFKQVSVNKFEHVVRGGSVSKEETGPAPAALSRAGTGEAHANPFNNTQTPESKPTTGNASPEKVLLRRQSTNAGPRPPRPPPPTAAALSRAMSVDQSHIAMTYSKDSMPSKVHNLPPTLEPSREEEEERFGRQTLSAAGGTGQTGRNDNEGDDDDESSASEYGAYGDQPVYKSEGEVLDTSNRPSGSDALDDNGEGGIAAKQVEHIIDLCVPALINGTWYRVQEKEDQLRDVLGTSTGRICFVNKIEQESVRTQGQLDPSALPALLDKISLLLNGCEDAEDFAPAKKILTVSLLFYVVDSGSPNERTVLFNYIKSQPIWQSLRFWNACFFQSVQEARAKLGEQARTEKKAEEIAFEQLRSYLNTMNIFELHETIKHEFLRKHSSLFNLTDEETQSLRAIIDGTS